MKKIISLIVLILVVLVSCLYDNDCILWENAVKNSTWVSENSQINFYENGGSFTSSDTTYNFGSFTSDDSFYLYKLDAWDRFLAVTVDSTPIQNLDRVLVGTEFEFDCDEAEVVNSGKTITYNIR